MKPFDFYKAFIGGATVPELAETYQVSEAVVQQSITVSRDLIPHDASQKTLIDTIARLMFEVEYLKEVREEARRGVEESAVQVQKGGEHEKNVVKGKTLTTTYKKPLSVIASISKTILDIEKFIAQLLGLLKLEDDDIYKQFAAAIKAAQSPPETYETKRIGGRN